MISLIYVYYNNFSKPAVDAFMNFKLVWNLVCEDLYVVRVLI